ncbi:MAG: hypothetical protein P1U42_03685 [Phycisphaerales bacterium]|nr:hypothetical protein [Phycisphaerales bacterium]
MPYLLLFYMCISSNLYGQSDSKIFLNEKAIKYWCSDSGKFGMGSFPDQAFVKASAKDIDLENPDTVLLYILESLQEINKVYPTERYYYYAFVYKDKQIAGNIRFADIEQGLVHIAYYDIHDQEYIVSKTFSGNEQIDIAYTKENGVVKLEYKGVEKTFVLNTEDLDRSSMAKLLSSEKYISGIMDESGYKFHLIYDESSTYFFYVLNEENMPEIISKITTENGHELYIGSRSRFVFYHDDDLSRKILIGVLQSSVQSNNYFDGPFDQVPPNLSVRDQLQQAYPYVRLRGGIDEHGNFKQQDGQRVAVSPYMQYGTVRELAKNVDLLYRPMEPGNLKWIMMCHEWKRDFHRTLNEYLDSDDLTPVTHSKDISRKWPSNHWSKNSQTWKLDHSYQTSKQWGANVAAPSDEDGLD